MNLEKRIESLIESGWKDVEFDSSKLYAWVAREIDGSLKIEGADPIIRVATRNVVRRMRGPNGRRVFQNARITDAEGSMKHVWVQMRFADFPQAESIVDRAAALALSLSREANNLAVEAREYGHQIPLPFPQLERLSDTGT